MSGKSRRGPHKLKTRFFRRKRTLEISKKEVPLSNWEMLQLNMDRERLSPLRQQFLKGPGRAIWLSFALIVFVGLLVLLLAR